MTEFIADWIRNPFFWSGLLLLMSFWALNCWIRFRFGRLEAVGAALAIWTVLLVATQIWDPKGFFDARYWVSGAVTMGATAGPVLLFPLAFERGVRQVSLTLVGVACAVFGALAFPIVALYTVCALGIDCL